MMKTWKQLFSGASAQASAGNGERHQIAAAALLIEAALLDDEYGERERETIRRVLMDHFNLEDVEAREVLAEAQAAQQDAVQLYGFTKEIKDGLAPEERVRVIEMLWEVAYADGSLHDYEAHLVRRVAGLIYVSDQERGDARKRVLSRLGLSD